MDDLGEWVARVEAAVDAAGGVGIKRIDMPDRTRIAGAGFVGILPLWKHSVVTVGLLAMPGQAPERWRGLIETRGEALTLATDAATLLPRFLFTWLMSNDAGSGERLAKQWPGNAASLAELHSALGGDPATLAAVTDALGDPAGLKRLDGDFAEPGDLARAHRAIAIGIDPSPDFGAVADWIDATLDDAIWPAAASDDYGPWSRLVHARAAKIADLAGDDIELPPAVAIDLVEAFAGVDTGLADSPGWVLIPGEGSSRATITAIAGSLDPDDLADAQARDIVSALRNAGIRYDGLVHAEAVPVLDERGEGGRAWGVLHSAGWWMAQTLGAAPASIIDGARLLARHDGWSDVAFVIERSAQSLGSER